MAVIVIADVAWIALLPGWLVLALAEEESLEEDPFVGSDGEVIHVWRTSPPKHGLQFLVGELRLKTSLFASFALAGRADGCRAFVIDIHPSVGRRRLVPVVVVLGEHLGRQRALNVISGLLVALVIGVVEKVLAVAPDVPKVLVFKSGTLIWNGFRSELMSSVEDSPGGDVLLSERNLHLWIHEALVELLRLHGSSGVGVCPFPPIEFDLRLLLDMRRLVEQLGDSLSWRLWVV